MGDTSGSLGRAPQERSTASASLLALFGGFFLAYHVSAALFSSQRLSLSVLVVLVALMLGSLAVERTSVRWGQYLLLLFAVLAGLTIPVAQRLGG